MILTQVSGNCETCGRTIAKALRKNSLQDLVWMELEICKIVLEKRLNSIPAVQ